MQKEYEFVEISSERHLVSAHTFKIGILLQGIEIYRCPKSTGVFGVDSSWLMDNDYGLMVSPFDPHIIFDFGREDKETLEEKQELRNEWMEENIPK